MDTASSQPTGRGSHLNPPNRFGGPHAVPDWEHFECDADEIPPQPATAYYPDQSQTVISENDSPDVPFRYSLNPYRGCLHGCSSCYRPPKYAPAPHCRTHYGARASGRSEWRRKQPGATSTTSLMESQPCVMAP